MFDFGPDVGIEFTESASGHVAQRISDPEAAERLAKSRGSSFQFSLQVSIPQLGQFLDSAVHIAGISGGTVSWKPDVTTAPVLPGGQVTLFRKADSSRKHKFNDYVFSFAGSGRTFDCRGVKDLQDENGLDVSTDLSTINLTMQADGQLAGSGVVRSNLLDFVRQLQSCRVTGAKSADEEHAARKTFLGFLNAELREVYPTLPVIFADTAQFTPEQRRTLELCARLLLPADLPPAGPQIDDVTSALDRFLANASASLLTTITNWLQVIGTFIPADGADPRLLRLLVTAQLNNTARSPIRDVLQLIHTLVVFPYYSHAKADKLLGYSRPVHQPRNTPDLQVVAEPPDRVFDFVIAGSGPAGTLLAQRLSAKGKSVLLLESGPYIPERTMDADEILGTARLYKSSGLQQANAAAPLAGSGRPRVHGAAGSVRRRGRSRQQRGMFPPSLPTAGPLAEPRVPGLGRRSVGGLCASRPGPRHQAGIRSCHTIPSSEPHLEVSCRQTRAREEAACRCPARTGIVRVPGQYRGLPGHGTLQCWMRIGAQAERIAGVPAPS